ncbi:MAG: CpsD/CapB family tyrosine-protein kinase, partial [Candidatus Omnitrophica bacterium]|nr:CpsD/CapB family tyrosine-protein kinase [Candidatus Omnitrophota bacterium]
LREGLTKTLQTRWEFEQLLGIPFLGYIPQIKTQKAKARTAKKEGLVLLSEPHSPSAEAIRTIRTTLEFLLPVGQPHALVITSALPEEGKTFTSLNLAMALQELGRKVLLVDGDLRRPTLHRHFQIQFEPGLSDYLQDKAAAEDLIQATPLVSGLSVIPAGSTPVQSTDLLSGSKLRDLIDRWKKEFQYVLIDAPPVLVAADSTVLANAAEGAIYIVRAGRTHREASQAGKQRLMDVGVKIIGGILNGAHMELQHGYRYYYYYRGGERRRAPASPPAES